MDSSDNDIQPWLTAGGSSGGASNGDPGRKYKGHIQPYSVHERLQQMKVFLADEDRHRCLEFDRKLVEIEEYLKNVEEEKLGDDEELFQTVKVMTATQRDWHDRFMDAPPIETTCCDKSSILPNSTRLIDAVTGRTLQEEREAMGLITQMREDHPPFTVERSKDHLEFLNALMEDACAEPGIKADEDNLLYIEGGAYSWALDQPSLIPYWTHWKKGLSNTGVKPTDPRPWYQAAPALYPNDRPPQDQLPKYLQAYEAEINKYLKSDNKAVFHKLALAKLLRTHMNKDMAFQYDEVASLAARRRCGLLSKQENSHLLSLLQSFLADFDIWVHDFKYVGAQIMIRREGVEEFNLPGVFYMPLHQPSDEAILELKPTEDRINILLNKEPKSSRESKELEKLLEPYLPDDVQTYRRECIALIIQALKISRQDYDATDDKLVLYLRACAALLVDEATLLHKSESGWRREYDSWLKSLNTSPETSVKLRYRVEGELSSASRHILSRTWDPTTPPEPEDMGRPPPEVKRIESEINEIIDQIATTGLKNISEVKPKILRRLELKLRLVMPPDLRKLAAEAVVSNHSADPLTTARDNMPSEIYKEVYERWRQGILFAGIRTRVPQAGDVERRARSTTLYQPRESQFPASCRSLAEWTALIRLALTSLPSTYVEEQIENYRVMTYDKVDLQDVELGELYHLLGPLQYSTLRQMDQQWRKLCSHANTELKQQLRLQWLRGFYSWIGSFAEHIEVARWIPAVDSQYPPDDPSVVVYRGPVELLREREAQPPSSPRDLLSDDVKQDHDHIQLLLANTLLNRPLSADDRNVLEVLICKYWVPGFAYHNSLEDHSPQSTAQFRKRLECFISLSARYGFQILPLSNRVQGRPYPYMAPDRTMQFPELWKVDEDLEIATGEGEILKSRLIGEWPQTQQFCQSLSDLQTAINRLLSLISDRKVLVPGSSIYTALLEILRPFWPPVLEAYHEEEEEVLKNLYFKRWLFVLADHRKNCGVVQIQVHEAPLSSEVFKLYPTTLHFAAPIYGNKKNRLMAPPSSSTRSTSTRSLGGYRRLQNRINELLPRYYHAAEHPYDESCQMTWETDEELHCLLRVVMPPHLAEIDREMRTLGDRFRGGVLEQGEYANYMIRLSEWREIYHKWVMEFAGKIVTLRPLEPTSLDSPGGVEGHILYIFIDPSDVPQEMPRRNMLPAGLKSVQETLNKTLRQSSSPQWEGEFGRLHKHLLKNYFLPTMKEVEQELKKKLLNLNGNGMQVDTDATKPENMEDIAYIKGIKRIKFQMLLQKLSVSLRSDQTILEIYNPQWGIFELREVSSLNRQPVPRLRTEMVQQPPDGLDDKQFSTVATVFLRGAKAVRQNNANVSQQENWIEIGRILNRQPVLRGPPDVSEARAAHENLVAKKTQLDHNKRILPIELQHLPYPDAKQKSLEEAADKALRHLWAAFAELCPQELQIQSRDVISCSSEKVAKQVIKEMKNKEIHADLDGVVSPVLQVEVDKVCVKLNTMLKDQVDKIGTDELKYTILEYLLRPLLTGHLGTLSREISRLSQKHRTGIHLTTTETVALNGYRSQYERDFSKWITTLAQRGLILDEIYTGPLVLRDVIDRFRSWEEAMIAKSQELVVTSSTDVSSEAIKKRQVHYQLLKRWLFDPDYVDSASLQLHLIPQNLQTLLIQLSNLKTKESGQTFTASDKIVIGDLESTFTQQYMNWYNNLPTYEFNNLSGDGALAAHLQAANSGLVDFSGKAERRGVQRASIELALNLFATSTDQLRPHDKFRKVRFPPKYQSPLEEVPLCKPLNPHERPVEMGTTKYTNILRRYRQWKDTDYQDAVDRANESSPNDLSAQENYLGPSVLKSDDSLAADFQERQHRMVALQRDLIAAEQMAPRPLVRRLLLRLNQGLSNVQFEGLVDETPLSLADIEILKGIAQPSWNNEINEYPSPIPVDNVCHFQEFEKDLAKCMPKIPFWEPALVSDLSASDPNDPVQFEQHSYNKKEASGQVYSLQQLLREINKVRLQEAINDGVEGSTWSLKKVTPYLQVMHDANRIQLGLHISRVGRADNHSFNSVPRELARIPPTGHPEDKYFLSRQAVQAAPYVKEDKTTREYSVQYDFQGLTGPPIIQPNKYEYLQLIAFRLGRDIRVLTAQLACEHSPHAKYKLQHAALEKANVEMIGITADRISEGEREISLKKLARDLHKVAPELAAELPVRITADPASLSEQQAAQLLQMQIIQESNNKWEASFPEKENVWDFAAPRLTALARHPQSERMVPVKRVEFFNMRRWPPACQNSVSRTEIASQGPALQPDIDDQSRDRVQTNQQRESAKHPPNERHTGRGQPPFFAFGETPMMQSWLSFRMEDDLKNVEDFNPKDPSRVGQIRRSKAFKAWIDPLAPDYDPGDFVDNSKLPDLPPDWDPDSVTFWEKGQFIAEKLIATPHFPSVPEAYYTPAEIAFRKQRLQSQEIFRKMQDARDLVENGAFLPTAIDDLTQNELKNLQIKYNIDPFTGQVRTKKTPTANNPITQPQTMTSAARGSGSDAATTGHNTTERGKRKFASRRKEDAQQSLRKKRRLNRRTVTRGAAESTSGQTGSDSVE